MSQTAGQSDPATIVAELLPAPVPASAPALPTRRALLEEYKEAGQFERLHVQLAFNYLAVFLAATGGALTVFRAVPTDARDLRVATALFSGLLSVTFLAAGERRARRVRMIQRRARAIEAQVGFALHTVQDVGSDGRELVDVTALLYRAVYAAAVVVWLYAVVRTLVT